jgi:hypothetical protein
MIGGADPVVPARGRLDPLADLLALCNLQEAMPLNLKTAVEPLRNRLLIQPQAFAAKALATHWVNCATVETPDR